MIGTNPSEPRRQPTNRGGWRLIRDSALYGLAGAVGKALALVTVPVLSRLLGPADYGLADLATSFSSLAVLLVTFSGDIPAARLAAMSTDARSRRRVHASWMMATLAVSSASAILLLPFAGALANDVWSSADGMWLAVLAIVLIPVTAVQSTLVSVLRIERRAVASAAMATLDLVAQLGLGVGLVVAGFGPVGLVAGLVLGGLIGLVGAAIAAAPHFLGRPSRSLATRVVMLGLPFVPGTAMFIAADYVVRYLALEGMGSAEVGQLAVATRIAGVMLLVSAAFSLAWGPYGMAQPTSARTSRLFGRVTEAFGATGAIVALTVAAIGPELTAVLSGSAFIPAAQALPGLLLAAVMSGLFYVLTIAAGVQERTRGVPVAALGGALVQVALTAVLIPPLGMAGIGLSAMAGRGLSLVILAVETRQGITLRAVGAGIWIVVALIASGLAFAAIEPAATLPYRLVLIGGLAMACIPLWSRVLRPLAGEFRPSDSAPA